LAFHEVAQGATPVAHAAAGTGRGEHQFRQTLGKRRFRPLVVCSSANAYASAALRKFSTESAERPIAKRQLGSESKK
jgi:hypothetical protein